MLIFLQADFLVKILFAKAHVLCHDTNQVTKNVGHLDVVMGTSTGDIIWLEAYTQKYFRINKNARSCDFNTVDITLTWLQGIINSSPVTDIHWLPGSEHLFLAAHVDGTLIVYDKEREDATFIPEEANDWAAEIDGLNLDYRPLHINKSVNSKNQKTNPVSAWRLSYHRINELAFSPDCRHLAVVSEDGALRIVNYLKEQ